MALAGWSVGDFLIQRNTRKFGVITLLFFITAFGSIVLTPFVITRLGDLGEQGWRILFLAGILTTAAAFFEFEGLRRGKLSVIGKIIDLEHTQSTRLEPMREWIKTASNLNEIAAAASLISKRDLAHQIFGLYLHPSTLC